MKKRCLLHTTILAGVLLVHLAASAAAPVGDVYKTASCGCCVKWTEHLRSNGFEVEAHDVDSPSDYRQKLGIPEALGACHTAMVASYAIEGHVPATEIKRLLAQRPEPVGLAVPSMPMGSPGMEGSGKDPYDVFLVQANSEYATYRHYDTK